MFHEYSDTRCLRGAKHLLGRNIKNVYVNKMCTDLYHANVTRYHFDFTPLDTCVLLHRSMKLIATRGVYQTMSHLIKKVLTDKCRRAMITPYDKSISFFIDTIDKILNN